MTVALGGKFSSQEVEQLVDGLMCGLDSQYADKILNTALPSQY